eukprot:4461483-Amphidinium_carterae.2
MGVKRIEFQDLARKLLPKARVARSSPFPPSTCFAPLNVLGFGSHACPLRAQRALLIAQPSCGGFRERRQEQRQHLCANSILT